MANFTTTMSLNTVVDYKVLNDYNIPEFLQETFDNVLSFEDVALNGDACEADMDAWSNDVLLLNQYGVVSAITLGSILSCFTEDEQNAILEHINSYIDEDCPFTSEYLWNIRYNTDNYSYNQLYDGYLDYQDRDDGMYRNDNYSFFDYLGDFYIVYSTDGIFNDEEQNFTTALCMPC